MVASNSRLKPLNHTYGLWAVIRRDPDNSKLALCKCACGKERNVDIYSLRIGKSTSCGCGPRPIRNDLKGKKFGNLLVIKEDNCDSIRRRWLCACDCGTIVSVEVSNLTGGKVTRCSKHKRKYDTKKSLSKTREYSIWSSMMKRCYNPNNPAFTRYGGRGIFVCDRWKTFINFYEDVAPVPNNASIDRIDNDKGYSLENIRFASAKTQRINQSSRVLWATIDNRTQCISDWIKEKRLPRGRVYYLIDSGYSPEEAVLKAVSRG